MSTSHRLQFIKPSPKPAKQAAKTTKRGKYVYGKNLPSCYILSVLPADLQVKQYEVSKGIIALSFNTFLKEVSVTYICTGSPVVRLSMCGECVVSVCVCACMCVCVCVCVCVCAL